LNILDQILSPAVEENADRENSGSFEDISLGEEDMESSDSSLSEEYESSYYTRSSPMNIDTGAKVKNVTWANLSEELEHVLEDPLSKNLIKFDVDVVDTIDFEKREKLINLFFKCPSVENLFSNFETTLIRI